MQVIVSVPDAPWIISSVMRSTAAPVLVFATVLVADAIGSSSLADLHRFRPSAAMVPTWGNVLSGSSSLSVLLG